MRKFCVFFAWVVILSSATAALAQEEKSKSSGTGDKAKIEALYQAYLKAFNAKDVNALMACYSPKDLYVFDAIPPRAYPSWDAYKKDWEGLFTAFPGPVSYSMSEVSITVVGSLAYAHNIQTGYFTDKNGSRLDAAVRVTDVLRKTNGKWLIVHEHVSVPVDLMTGKADLLSKP